jgi:hypothetical protein
MNTTSKPTTKRAAVGGAFIKMLQTPSAGINLYEIDSNLTEMIEEVVASGKPGELTIKVKVARNGAKGVKIQSDCVVKLPKQERRVGFAYIGPDGVLQANDPDQAEMGFVVADGGKAAAPVAAPATPLASSAAG